ncbi:hypothetical protein Dimus_033658 [Dionaea muscipula]
MDGEGPVLLRDSSSRDELCDEGGRFPDFFDSIEVRRASSDGGCSESVLMSFTDGGGGFRDGWLRFFVWSVVSRPWSSGATASRFRGGSQLWSVGIHLSQSFFFDRDRDPVSTSPVVAADPFLQEGVYLPSDVAN